MECHECGTTILARASFCHECGTPAKRRKRKRRSESEQPNSERSARRERRSRADDGDFEDREFEDGAQTRWDWARRQIKSSGTGDQENYLWSGTFSYKGMANQFLAAVAATIILPIAVTLSGARPTLVNWSFIILGLVWVALLVNLVIRKLDVHYELTNQRLIHKYGILRRTVNRIEVIDIDDILFEQGIVERLLGAGTIEIISSDKTDPTIELQGIDEVFEVAELIDEARRAERIRRGVHIESV